MCTIKVLHAVQEMRIYPLGQEIVEPQTTLMASSAEHREHTCQIWSCEVLSAFVMMLTKWGDKEDFPSL